MTQDTMPQDTTADLDYAGFLTRALAAGALWTLKGEGGYVAFHDDEAGPCFPFWTSPEGAQALATADWADCRPERIGLADLRGVWLPGMGKAGRRLTLEPSPDGEGLICDPGELLADLA
jgi:hypothetical protein